jgi:hypothetical protein
MVPGDWVYLKNVPDYEIEVPYGAFAGENALYIRERTRGDPTSRVFFGFGLEPRPSEPRRFLTEQELAAQWRRTTTTTPRDDRKPDPSRWTGRGSAARCSTAPTRARRGLSCADAWRWRDGGPVGPRG